MFTPEGMFTPSVEVMREEPAADSGPYKSKDWRREVAPTRVRYGGRPMRFSRSA
jgi:hypothetical protein